MSETHPLWLFLLVLIVVAYWKLALLGVVVWLVLRFGVEPLWDRHDRRDKDRIE